MERIWCWLISVLSKEDWAEAMLAEADHLPEGSARRRWLASAALAAVAGSVGRLVGICVAGALVSYAVWRHPDPEVSFLTLAVVLLSAVAGGFVWLHALRRSTASGVVAAAFVATATMPFGGPFSELGVAGVITLPLMLAAVAAVIAMTLARMLHRSDDDRRAFISGLLAAMVLFMLAIVAGAGGAFLGSADLGGPAMYVLGLAGGPAIGLVAATVGIAIARPGRAKRRGGTAEPRITGDG